MQLKNWLYQAFSLFLFVHFFSLEANAIEKEDAPNIYVEKPIFNFGIQDNTETVHHNFIIENRGNSPLEIIQIKASCGCTTAQLKNHTIPPQSTEELKASLSLAKRKGKQKKKITLTSNDPKNPKYHLFFKGKAKALIDVIPYSIRFSLKAPEVSETRSLLLSSKDQIPFRIMDIKKDQKAYQVSSKTLEEGYKYKIEVTTLPSASNKSIYEKLIIKTTHPKMNEIIIPISIRFKPDLSCAPSQIRIKPSANNKGPYSVRLVLRSPSGKPFEVTKVTPPSKKIKSSIQQVSPTMYKINIINIPYTPLLNHKNIVIDTTMKKSPKILVPIKFLPSTQQRSKIHKTINRNKGFLTASVKNT